VQDHLPVGVGSLVHLGPLHRGVTLRVDEVVRVGDWRERALESLATTTGLVLRRDPTGTRELRVARWPRLVAAAATISVGVTAATAALVFIATNRALDPLGPVYEQEERVLAVDSTTPVDPRLFEELDQGFYASVMAPNAEVADWPELATDKALWDTRLHDMVARSMKAHLQQWPFWRRLDAVRTDYASVVRVLRERHLPEVLAAIPYYESQYRAEARGMDCELGHWQLLPEVGLRAGLAIRNCHFSDTPTTWTPTARVPVVGVHDNAPYMHEGRCRITRCDQDERADLARSAPGVAGQLAEAWNDPVLRASGAAVQLVISSHNAGYDNARQPGGTTNLANVLPAYQAWVASHGGARAPDFVGWCKNLGVPDRSSIPVER
jgi:hypothetical protein